MKTAFLAAFIALLSSPVALAQSGGAEPQSKGQDAPVVGHATLGVQISELNWVAVGYRASKLLGSPVWNDKDQKVGKLTDLIIKPDGKVSIAILDVGGFLGMGAHQVAIPVSQFSAVTPKITLPGATKDALKALPEFSFNRVGAVAPVRSGRSG